MVMFGCRLLKTALLVNYCLFCKIVASLRESIIYSDCWVAYDGLVDYGAKAHYRVKHSKNEFALGRNHINGIENFLRLC